MQKSLLNLFFTLALIVTIPNLTLSQAQQAQFPNRTAGIRYASQSTAKLRKAQWQIYKNPAYGFSIQYPSNWEISPMEGGSPLALIYPHNPKPHEFYITIGLSSKPMDAIRADFAEFTRRSSGSRFIERKIVFAGENAFQFTRTDNPGFCALYILHGGKMYRVTAARFDLAIVRRAITTFQFVD